MWMTSVGLPVLSALWNCFQYVHTSWPNVIVRIFFPSTERTVHVIFQYPRALKWILNEQNPEHMLQNCPIRAPESPGSPTHATKLSYPCTWTSVIPDTSYRTGLPIHLKVQGPQHILTKLLYPYTCTSKIPNISYTTALSMHLNVQCPQHILQNCPTHTPESPRSWICPAQLPHHTPESPGPPTQHTLYTSPTHTPESPESWTRPTHQPYPYTCKSSVPYTSYTRFKILKVRGPEHILHNCPTHTPERQWSGTYPMQLPYPCTWKSKVSNSSSRTHRWCLEPSQPHRDISGLISRRVS